MKKMSDGLPKDDYEKQARERAASELNDLLSAAKAERMRELEQMEAAIAKAEGR